MVIMLVLLPWICVSTVLCLALLSAAGREVPEQVLQRPERHEAHGRKPGSGSKKRRAGRQSAWRQAASFLFGGLA